ncbi:hypothetical protein B0T25DRAFT_534615 [Lasiosphaeria hispida]|uniref:Ribosomal protein L34 n=1 Tax=Lasiosphaeria hispida TaxID=260671 RepID=A0AAJ0HRM3_9PEZI|nr:hypothetical protein B0T25DRAFT_534615 [Lasiosphaeria hispida]
MPRIPIPSQLLQAALRPSFQLLPRCLAQAGPTCARSFSNLPGLRPTLVSQAAAPTAFRTGLLSRLPPSLAATDATMVGGAAADVVPKSSISLHPALAGTQIRCGPRATMSGHSRLVQKRRHGFLSRSTTKNGVKMLKRRRVKGRRRLSA